MTEIPPILIILACIFDACLFIWAIIEWHRPLKPLYNDEYEQYLKEGRSKFRSMIFNPMPYGVWG